ncbi:MAG: peptidoglycan DD-metalloendopeptidase family protein [Leptospiraceae bacterium]|nr:peptidoglycan DD-metalloendopeptidase family protein [Leptospiraceae bacterium]
MNNLKPNLLKILFLSTILIILNINAQEPGTKLYIIKTESLRAKPSDLGSDTVESLIPGDEVTVVYVEESLTGKDRDALVRIKTAEGKEGYIPFLSLSKKKPKITTPVIRSIIVPKKLYVTADVLNVRAGPGTDSEIVGVVRRNDLVEIVYYSDKTEFINGISDRWAFVRFGTQGNGYVFGGFLSENESVPPEPGYDDSIVEPETPAIGSEFYVRPAKLQLRKEPGSKGKVIDSVSQNTKVKVIEHSEKKELIAGSFNLWVKIEAGSDKGWVFGGFLSISSEKPLASDRLDKVFINPLRDGTYRRSSDYGERVHPVLKTRRFHSGVDFAAPSGTPIYAAADGVVDRTMKSNGYGNLTIVKHPNGLFTYYAHQVKFGTKSGAKVRAGEQIGYVGTTGMSTGNHLHLEVRDGFGGSHFNPDNYIYFPEKNN